MRPSEPWPPPPAPDAPQRCLVCVAWMPTGNGSGEHSPECTVLRERGLNLVEMNRGRVARGMPALTAAEALDLLDAAAGPGENRQTPSAQQVRDVERAVQSARDGLARTGERSLCGLTANDLAVIAWALAITSGKLLELEDTRAALRRVQAQFAYIEKTMTGPSALIDGVEAERAKGNAP